MFCMLSLKAEVTDMLVSLICIISCFPLRKPSESLNMYRFQSVAVCYGIAISARLSKINAQMIKSFII